MSARFAAILHASRKAGPWLLCLAVSAIFSSSPFHSRALAQKAPSSETPPTCATCHAGLVRSFSTAPMHHAMEPEGANPELIAHPDLSTTIGPYTYRVQTREGHSTYSVTDGSSTVSEPIHLTFGQRTQTWILEKDGAYYETLVSYFPRDNVLDKTPDDAGTKPANLSEAMGRRLEVAEVRTCFDCHASGINPGEKLDPTKTIPGITCERCHAGSQQHMADAAQDNFKTLPKALKHLDAHQISNFCGQCHRTFDTVVRDRMQKVAVRFQPYRLELSKCFIGNNPRISCIACHNPHQPLDHETAHYDAKCLACHNSSKTAAVAGPPKLCPVAKANCTSCHMQKVEVSGNHAKFTDHYIRIVHPNQPYPE